MHHIFGIEPVIAQFVQNQFIGREIKHILWESGLQPVYSQQQDRLTELIGMHAFAYMADRADGKYHFQSGVARQQPR